MLLLHILLLPWKETTTVLFSWQELSKSSQNISSKIIHMEPTTRVES